jgi:hypothetical protein
MRRLTGMGAQVVALRQEGIDAWTAQRRGTCRRRHVGEEQGRIWGKTAPTGGSQLAVTVAHEMVTGRLTHGIGLGGTAVLGQRGENGPRPFFQFNFLLLF